MASAKEEEEKALKIDKWDGNAVKNALDDTVKKVITEHFQFVECHRLMDGRLFICTVAVAFAGFALVWDYLNPFPKSKPVLITCVLSYFVMMGILTLYTTFKEKGVFLLALDKDKAGIDPDNTWRISSQMKSRYDHLYNLAVNYTDGQTSQERTSNFTKSIANYFDDNGQLCNDLFEPEVKKLVQSLMTEKKVK